jgi:hypothetical protein
MEACKLLGKPYSRFSYRIKVIKGDMRNTYFFFDADFVFFTIPPNGL